MDSRPNTDTKACFTCASNIPSAAKKCIECGSYLDWRRFLDLGNSSIALLIALLSVIGLAADRIYSAYNSIQAGSIPAASISIVSFGDQAIRLLYSALGNSSVVADDAILCNVPVVKRDSEYYAKRIDLINEDRVRYPTTEEVLDAHMLVYVYDSPNAIVDPGSSKILEYRIHQRRPYIETKFDKDLSGIPGYCSVTYRHPNGIEEARFIAISELDVLLIQKPLVTNPSYGYSASAKFGSSLKK